MMRSVTGNVAAACLAVAVAVAAPSVVLGDTSDVYDSIHRYVVSVETSTASELTSTRSFGTGFLAAIDGATYVITAAHVTLKGHTFNVTFFADGDHTSDGHNGDGLGDPVVANEWCEASLVGLDLPTDVSVLTLAPDCATPRELSVQGARGGVTGTAGLPFRTQRVKPGLHVTVVGDGSERRAHSVISGEVSSAYIRRDMTDVVLGGDRDRHNALKFSVADPTCLESRWHELTLPGSWHGDSGSAVLDNDGAIVGIVSSGNTKVHSIVHVVSAEYVHAVAARLVRATPPRYAGCTAHESVLLGREYWGGQWGTSYHSMWAAARASGAKYFAVAAGGVNFNSKVFTAHGFTVATLWDEDDFPGDFAYERRKKPTKECADKVLQDAGTPWASPAEVGLDADGTTTTTTTTKTVYGAGCADRLCNISRTYKLRDGETNHRRWVIYELQDFSGSGEDAAAAERAVRVPSCAADDAATQAKVNKNREDEIKFQGELDKVRGGSGNKGKSGNKAYVPSSKCRRWCAGRQECEACGDKGGPGGGGLGSDIVEFLFGKNGSAWWWDSNGWFGLAKHAYIVLVQIIVVLFMADRGVKLRDAEQRVADGEARMRHDRQHYERQLQVVQQQREVNERQERDIARRMSRLRTAEAELAAAVEAAGAAEVASHDPELHHGPFGAAFAGLVGEEDYSDDGADGGGAATGAGAGGVRLVNNNNDSSAEGSGEE